MSQDHKTTIYLQGTCGPIFMPHTLDYLSSIWRSLEFDQLFDLRDCEGRRWVFPVALITAMASTDVEPEDADAIK